MNLLLLLKFVATVLLVAMLGGLAWAVTHLGKIKRELIADEALPKPAPARRIIILYIGVLIAFSALLIGFLFYKS